MRPRTRPGYLASFVLLPVLGVMPQSAPTEEATCSDCQQSEADCSEISIDEINAALASAGWSCYGVTTVGRPGRERGRLVHAQNGEEGVASLIWVSKSDGQSIIEVVHEAGSPVWGIEGLDDYDRDGAPDLFIVEVGGAGLYYYMPKFLRLGEDQRWSSSFSETFFYGNGEVLPSERPGAMRFRVSSVDDGAEWAFSECSMCAHPYHVEIYEIASGKSARVSEAPVHDPLRSVSDFILAVRRESGAALMRLLAPDATLLGVGVRSQTGLDQLLARERLGEGLAGCYEDRRDGEGEDAPIPTVRVSGRDVPVFQGQFADYSADEIAVLLQCHGSAAMQFQEYRFLVVKVGIEFKIRVVERDPGIQLAGYRRVANMVDYSVEDTVAIEILEDERIDAEARDRLLVQRTDPRELCTNKALTGELCKSIRELPLRPAIVRVVTLDGRDLGHKPLEGELAVFQDRPPDGFGMFIVPLADSATPPTVVDVYRLATSSAPAATQSYAVKLGTSGIRDLAPVGQP